MTINQNSKIYIAGHSGMVGSAIWRCLEKAGFTNLTGKTSKELDLRNQVDVIDFFEKEKPDAVVLAAARVGGILANRDFPVQFLNENIQIQSNIIATAHNTGVSRLIFLGSSCIYPKLSQQPIREEYLLTGALEETNQWYAIAKIAGLKLCEAYRQQYGRQYISLMPTNLYGPNDNFDLKTSHVLPAMIRKFHEGKQEGKNSIELWGSGEPKREFLHVDDLAEAVKLALTSDFNENLYNVGTGSDLTIRELAETVKSVVGYEGHIKWDTSKPNGTPRKVLNVDRIKAAGWSPEISLKSGIAETYRWYLENAGTLRKVGLD